MIRIAIVDDDETDSGRLETLLKSYGRENSVELGIACFSDPVMFVERYTANYEIIFFDIEMPMLDGIAAAEKIRETDDTVVLIFVTRMAQLAVRGYKVRALDFIVKPINPRTLSLTMASALKAVELVSGEDILIPMRGGLERVSAKNIYYIEVRKHTLIYHTAKGIFERYGALKSVEADLKKLKFVKCNSCFLVNPRHVKKIRDHTVTVGGDELIISHPKKKEFMTALVKYFGEE